MDAPIVVSDEVLADAREAADDLSAHESVSPFGGRLLGLQVVVYRDGAGYGASLALVRTDDQYRTPDEAVRALTASMRGRR